MRVLAIAALISLSSCGFTSGLVGQEPLSQIEKAQEEQVKATLLQAWQAETTHYIETGKFATNLTELGLTPPSDVAVSFTQLTQDDFCVQATHTEASGLIWHMTKSDEQPAEGSC